MTTKLEINFELSDGGFLPDASSLAADLDLFDLNGRRLLVTGATRCTPNSKGHRPGLLRYNTSGGLSAIDLGASENSLTGQVRTVRSG